MSTIPFKGIPASQQALKLTELGYRLPHGKSLVQGINLSLEVGDRLAIVGPNGAGKSTLLRLLAGLLSATKGQIFLNQRDARCLSDEERAQRIAFLPQQLTADQRLTVTEFVALGCLPYARQWSVSYQRDQVIKCLASCRLMELKNYPLAHLSGGELQRANLARTLAQKPALLLLDEPTNHLDPKSSIELLAAVATLGITCIAVLHDLAFVPHWATHVLVMSAGSMVSFGAPETALTSQRVEQVFSTPAFYLPHPTRRSEMLIIDRSGSGPAPALAPSF